MRLLRRAAALFTVVVFANISIAADDTSMNAIQLLAAYTGKAAEQYEPVFRYSNESRIVGFEIHAVGMDNTTARYSDQEPAWKEVNNILRIMTADGFEGVSGVDTYYQDEFSQAHALQLQGVIGDVLAINSVDPVEVSAMLKRAHPDLSGEVRASIDIALWDLAAGRANLPLSKMLGATRKSIEAYASLPFYNSLPEYVDAVNEYSRLGFRKFKFHVWGSIEEDLRLVKLIQQEFAETEFEFMVDLESVYDFEDAIRLGKQMDESLFFWFEAPINDELLDQYSELKKQLNVQIIPAGYNVFSADFIRQGTESGAWDAGRFDSTVVGGISQALELLIIANEAEVPIDIQSWGHSLGQAANLHLMLANNRTPYFEAPMPKSVFEFGMRNGNLLENDRAIVSAGAGLGISVEWDRLTSADFHVHYEYEASQSGNTSY